MWKRLNVGSLKELTLWKILWKMLPANTAASLWAFYHTDIVVLTKHSPDHFILSFLRQCLPSLWWWSPFLFPNIFNSVKFVIKSLKHNLYLYSNKIKLFYFLVYFFTFVGNLILDISQLAFCSLQDEITLAMLGIDTVVFTILKPIYFSNLYNSQESKRTSYQAFVYFFRISSGECQEQQSYVDKTKWGTRLLS